MQPGDKVKLKYPTIMNLPGLPTFDAGKPGIVDAVQPLPISLGLTGKESIVYVIIDGERYAFYDVDLVLEAPSDSV